MKKILLSLLLAGGVKYSFAMQGVGGAAAVGGSAATVGVLGTLHIHIDLSVLKTAAECSIRVEYTYCALATRASGREALVACTGGACHTT